MDQLDKAYRLNAITQKVGFALWQIQELEGVSSQYFVLVVQAKKGMGLDAGNALEEKAKKKNVWCYYPSNDKGRIIKLQT